MEKLYDFAIKMILRHYFAIIKSQELLDRTATRVRFAVTCSAVFVTGGPSACASSPYAYARSSATASRPLGGPCSRGSPVNLDGSPTKPHRLLPSGSPMQLLPMSLALLCASLALLNPIVRLVQRASLRRAVVPGDYLSKAGPVAPRRFAGRS